MFYNTVETIGRYSRKCPMWNYHGLGTISPFTQVTSTVYKGHTYNRYALLLLRVWGYNGYTHIPTTVSLSEDIFDTQKGKRHTRRLTFCTFAFLRRCLSCSENSNSIAHLFAYTHIRVFHSQIKRSVDPWWINGSFTYGASLYRYTDVIDIQSLNTVSRLLPTV